mmetsp:Transcript_21319/g.55645  ORF Transcript_21319/g.55645 Transcript_21319/m.55645 type:complete len:95 (-) Transcript_21319:1835-2119(-)
MSPRFDGFLEIDRLHFPQRHMAYQQKNCATQYQSAMSAVASVASDPRGPKRSMNAVGGARHDRGYTAQRRHRVGPAHHHAAREMVVETVSRPRR